MKPWRQLEAEFFRAEEALKKRENSRHSESEQLWHGWAEGHFDGEALSREDLVDLFAVLWDTPGNLARLLRLLDSGAQPGAIEALRRLGGERELLPFDYDGED